MISTRRDWTLDELRERLQYWQQRLGLSDWTFTLQFLNYRDINANGRTTYQAALMSADIRLLNPADIGASDLGTRDLEQTLVHELVHVRLWCMDQKDAEGAEWVCREQAIDWIAKALVAESRKNLEE